MSGEGKSLGRSSVIAQGKRKKVSEKPHRGEREASGAPLRRTLLDAERERNLPERKVPWTSS